jgi:hypothetical protein
MMSPNVGRSTSVVLMRNRTGDVIHRATCAAVKASAVRWRWADENPDEDWKKTAPWLKACQRCNPPSPLSAVAEPKDLMAELKRSLDVARGQKGEPSDG